MGHYPNELSIKEIRNNTRVSTIMARIYSREFDNNDRRFSFSDTIISIKIRHINIPE